MRFGFLLTLVMKGLKVPATSHFDRCKESVWMVLGARWQTGDSVRGRSFLSFSFHFPFHQYDLSGWVNRDCNFPVAVLGDVGEESLLFG